LFVFLSFTTTTSVRTLSRLSLLLLRRSIVVNTPK
jgi:hypothetical protein